MLVCVKTVASLGLFSVSVIPAAPRGTEPELLLWEVMQHKSMLISLCFVGVYPLESSGFPERELLVDLQW